MLQPSLVQGDPVLSLNLLHCSVFFFRNQKEVCISPFQAPIKYGLVFPFLFILLLILLLAIVLWLDWRYGKRMLYFHITEREERRNEPLHVETEEQKERRLERERADRERARLRA